MIVFGEHSTHHFLVDVYTKDLGNQESNPGTAIPGVAALGFDNGTDEFLGGTRGSRLSLSA